MKAALKFWRWILGASIIIFSIALWRFYWLLKGNISFFHSKYTLLWAIPLAVMALFFILSWTEPVKRYAEALSRKESHSSVFWKVSASIILVATLPLFTLIIFYPYYTAHSQWNGTTLGSILTIFSGAIGYLSVRFLVFWAFTLLGTVCLKIIWKNLSWQSIFIFSILLQASLYCAAVSFSTVNNYPFALGWSDASRIYDTSLFFAPRLYGQAFPLSVLHPTWHLLTTIPFFFGNLPVWIHRFWPAFLEFGLTLLTGIVFSERLGVKKGLILGATALWAFLFIRQISILFSVLICVIIIFAWVKPKRYWLSTLFLILASIWAGLSRINWFPVPGLLAAVIYLLEVPYSDSRSWLHYLGIPVSWFVIGTAIAFGTNSLYNLWSGNEISGGQFSSSLTSDLLWNRLLPSTVFPSGVLPGALLAGVPFVLLIVSALRRNPGGFHPLRLTGIFLTLVILFLGGLVVSVKIGGGGDLHNMDAFFVMLLLVGGYLYFGRWTSEVSEPSHPSQPALTLLLAVLIPVWFILQTGGPLFTWDKTDAADALNTIKSESEQTAQEGGQVLFMYQRHLLALKMVDVPLVPDYEQDFLMEMVMSHNQPYLDKFQADIKSQKFALIVAVNYGDQIQKDVAWSEENNLWVEEVVRPLKCYYEVVMGKDAALLKPRPTPCE